MQENDPIERKAKMPTEFYLSEKCIKKRIVFNGVFVFIFALGFILVCFIYSSIDRFVLLATILFGSIKTVVKLVYWIKQYATSENNRLIIKIDKTHIQFGQGREINKIHLDDISSIEIKRNWFGKYLVTNYKKELNHENNISPHSWMSFEKGNKKPRNFESWGIKGLNVDPEALVHSLSFHLKQFKTLT